MTSVLEQLKRNYIFAVIRGNHQMTQLKFQSTQYWVALKISK